ncbi:Ig-like domain-containing protein [Nocardioides sp. GY 10127]|uniref:Ig-like domain-containing protein n=1 Tax=Nocardioides sp. GY 10127 TaxID=2569762 RepID=UPI0010A7CD07|nr:Ig-like domain-containing protein [Nocardioides sp. GY 10127]TIC85578.1 hypothetical protein E8D37_02855 [Nocardioides sp. GY 10127]
MRSFRPLGALSSLLGLRRPRRHPGLPGSRSAGSTGSRALRLGTSALLVAGAAVGGVVALPGAATASVPTCAAAGLTVTSLGGPNFYIGSGSTPAFLSGYTGYRVLNGAGAELDDLYVTLSDFTGGALGLASGQTATQRVGDLASGEKGERFWYLTATGPSASAQQHTITVSQHKPGLPSSTVLCTTTNGFAQVAQTTSANANKVDTVVVAGGTPTIGATFTVTVTGNTGTIGSGVTGDTQSFWMTPSVSSTWPADAFRLVGTSLTMSPDGSAAPVTWTNTLRLADLGASARSYTAVYTFRAVGFTDSPATVRPVHQIASGNLMKYTGSYPATLPPITPPANDLTASASADPTALPTGGGTTTVTTSVSGTAGAELDEVDVLVPDGATPVPGTALWCGQPVADPELVGERWVVTGPFVLPGGGCDFEVDVTLPATPGAHDLTVEPRVGDSVVGTSTDVVDGSNAATVTVNVNRSPVALDRSVAVDAGGWLSVPVGSLASDPDGDPLEVTGVGFSTDGVTFHGPGLVHFLGMPAPEGSPFTYTVSDGRGGTATGQVTALPYGAEVPAAPQSVTVEPVSAPRVGGTTTVTASATSGLTVSLTTSTPETCSVVDHGDGTATLTAVAEGDCVVVATQAGDAEWEPATSVETVVALTRTPLVLGLLEAAPATLDVDGSTDLTATLNAELPVTWSSLTPDVCTVDDTGHVVALAEGTCRVQADAAGDSTHAPATPLEVEILVVAPAAGPSPQTVSATGPTPLLVGASGTVVASATSGLDVTFTSLTPGVCSVDAAGTVTALAAGECRIEVGQPGDESWDAAEPVVVTTTVAVVPVPPVLPPVVLPSSQTITADAPATVRVGAPVTVAGSASSGLAVTYTGLTPDVCTVDGAGQVTTLATGECQVRVSQPGNGSWAAATPVVVSVQVLALAAQHLVLEAPAVVLDGPSAVLVTATSDAGLPVTAQVSGPCRVRGTAHTEEADTVRLGVTGTGECTLTVSAAGDADHDDAEPATATLTVVAPVDDRLAVPAGTTRAVALDVQANDGVGAGEGVSLTAVSRAAHGTAAVADAEGGTVAYLPGARFAGTDSFRYTVADETGRTATAVVRVRVANAGPSVGAEDTAQLAGSTRTVRLDVSDPNGDAVRVTAESLDPGLRVKVDGDRLELTAERALSGRVRVRVLVTDDGGDTARTSFVDVVTPLPVAEASQRFVDSDDRADTRISWTRAVTDDARYEVLVDDHRVCVSDTLSCDVDRVLGPGHRVQVRVLGRDGTRSATTPAARVEGSRVWMATVYFDPDEHLLTPAQRGRLNHIAQVIRRLGFGRAYVEGYTDADGDPASNLALSQARTGTVATLLAGHGIGSDEAWFGESDPVASNSTATGKSRNRRVEIYVGW